MSQQSDVVKAFVMNNENEKFPDMLKRKKLSRRICLPGQPLDRPWTPGKLLDN